MFITVQVTIVDGVAAKTCNDYPTIAQAKESHHGFLSYNYNTAVLPTLEYFLAEILDKDGNIVARETYYAPAKAATEEE